MSDNIKSPQEWKNLIFEDYSQFLEKQEDIICRMDSSLEDIIKSKKELQNTEKEETFVVTW
jgi:hypothetical protein